MPWGTKHQRDRDPGDQIGTQADARHREPAQKWQQPEKMRTRPLAPGATLQPDSAARPFSPNQSIFIYIDRLTLYLVLPGRVTNLLTTSAAE